MKISTTGFILLKAQLIQYFLNFLMLRQQIISPNLEFFKG